MSPRFVRLLAAPVVALALGAGAAAVAPAASASIRPDCGWQSLTLLNGWQSAQASWNTGDPEYCVDNGIVYLAGSLKNPANADTEFAVLPSQELPTSNLDLLVYTYGVSAALFTASRHDRSFPGSEWRRRPAHTDHCAGSRRSSGPGPGRARP